jgi:hypothetical protein
MQDQIRQTLDDLVLLSQTLSPHDQQRVLETIERFRNIVEEDDASILAVSQAVKKCHFP